MIQFSIVVPTYNRPQQLVDCLRSLAQIEYPRDRFEVIVVDDGSDTPLDAAVNPFQEQLILRLIRQKNSGPAAARNYGAQIADGKYIAFTDDDCCPASDWLSRLDDCLAEVPDHIAGGHTVNALPHNPYSTTSQNIIDIVYTHYNPIRNQARFLTSNNMAVPANRFRELGGFDVSFRTSEDRDLCDRWLHQGYRIIYVPEAVVYHANLLKLRSFWKQHFTYGQGAFRFRKTRKKKGRDNFEIDKNYYSALLSYLFVNGKDGKGLTLTAVLLIAQVANFAGFFWEMLHFKFRLSYDLQRSYISSTKTLCNSSDNFLAKR